jgi:multidrug efflux system membrane fusion protein
MKPRCFFVPLPGACVAILLCLAGCGRATPGPKAAPMPTVSVSQPIVRDVTDYVDFTGRTEAPFSVDIRPRVTGYLVKMPFVEGAEVKENDLLFEIDPRPYQAQLDKAEGDVTLAEAKLKLAKADNARAKTSTSTKPPKKKPPLK